MKRLLVIVLLIPLALAAQNQEGIFVDKDGLMKWRSDSSAVALFGVNYTTPFAYSYRMMKRLGISHEAAIDMDVAQLAKLGLDAYRIHMWDREISDFEGNVLDNEHLRLFDYLLMKLEERGFYIILTPIAWWGTGWPEPDPETPGFSGHYSKTELITSDTARAAQRNYLEQIINHRNAYTGYTYKNDPKIIAFEIINEPKHPHDASMTAGYVNEMAEVLRSNGVDKPIFYNISENWSETQAPAVYNAGIDGISFQWYPAGLVKQSELKGNFLAHVNKYPVPDYGDGNLHNKARMVYEFDAADNAQPVMYPAMARSFREAGMQWATMFSYDPAFIARFNTEYNTHFLNLLYTPKKAISFMIAAEVFRNVKAYQQFGNYPGNLEFGDFIIDYEKQLSLYNSDEKFYYSNSTEAKPKNPAKLKHIAGAGESPLVSYNGSGSYFLDRLYDTTWQLEILPDAARTCDPFGRNSPDKEVARLYFKSSKMKFNLPGLDGSLNLIDVRQNETTIFNSDEYLEIKPGLYLVTTPWDNNKVETLKLFETAMNNYPEELIASEITLVHSPPEFVYVNGSGKLNYSVFSNEEPEETLIFLKKSWWRDFMEVPAVKTGKYSYEANFDAARLEAGKVEYCIYVKSAGGEMTYPSGVSKHPGNWDFYAEEFYTFNIIPDNSDLLLLSSSTDMSDISLPRVWSFINFAVDKVQSVEGTEEFIISVSNVRRQLNEFILQVEFDNEFREHSLSDYRLLNIELGETTRDLNNISINLVDSDLFSYKAGIDISNEREISIPLSDLKESGFVLLPRPYPRFLPYEFKRDGSQNINQSHGINFLQLGIGLSHLGKGAADASLSIEKISLSK